MASVVAMNVFGTVRTVSPGRTPPAINAKRSASVPLPTPTAWRTPQNSANSRSNASTEGPPTKAALARALRKTETSSASSSRCCATRSKNGTGAWTSEGDNFSSFLQRLIGRLEQPEHAQPRCAVVARRPTVQDAVDEIVELDFQCLFLLDLRYPDIARSVAHQVVVDVARIDDLRALVVDLDFLVGFKVVPHEHLVFAADQRGPHFDGGQPVDVDVRDQVVGKINRDERQIGHAVEVLPACG